ncbi:MAG TPA: hypothetical protein VEZ12_24305 [Herpetosiphonaceae bacterium]|jgi:hypothetical protein|nr:hypothetical protein [Herpetosiphonaceae bacterium]
MQQPDAIMLRPLSPLIIAIGCRRVGLPHQRLDRCSIDADVEEIAGTALHRCVARTIHPSSASTWRRLNLGDRSIYSSLAIKCGRRTESTP